MFLKRLSWSEPKRERERVHVSQLEDCKTNALTGYKWTKKHRSVKYNMFIF